MYQKNVTVTNKIGLHARPASQFVNIAKKFKCEITVINKEKSADAKSLVMLLTLGIKQGDEITIQADGEDEASAVDNLVEFVSNMGDQ